MHLERLLLVEGIAIEPAWRQGCSGLGMAHGRTSGQMYGRLRTELLKTFHGERPGGSVIRKGVALLNGCEPGS